MLKSREFYTSEFDRQIHSFGQLNVNNLTHKEHAQNIYQLCKRGVEQLDRATNVWGQTSRVFISEEYGLIAKKIRGTSNDDHIRSTWSMRDQKAFAPSKQIFVVRNACEIYWKNFAKELQVEEILAFLIANTGEKYMFYPRYERVWDFESENRYSFLAEELYSVGIHIGESFNHMSTPEGLVLIDTEFWHLAGSKEYCRGDCEWLMMSN